LYDLSITFNLKILLIYLFFNSNYNKNIKKKFKNYYI